MLVKRLSDHVLGKQDMSQTQIKAAEVLLKKALPDLQAVQNTHTGPGGGPVMISSTDAEL